MIPAPFEIVQAEGGQVASNGTATLTLRGDGRVFRRRGIKTQAGKPFAEAVLPMLNGLAGDLLADLSMPAEMLRQRLDDIAAAADPRKVEHIEWAVAELNGVRAYFDGTHVVLTTEDLMP